MKKAFLLLSLLLLTGLAFAQIVAWEFYGNAGNEITVNATTNDPNLNTSVISRGSGLNPSGLGNSFIAKDFTLNGTKADAITNNDYFEFLITANSNYKVSLSTLDACFRRTSSGPNTFQWQYSLDGFSTNGIDFGGQISYTGSDSNGNTQAQIDLSAVNALQDVASGTVITFRLYIWGNTGTAGTFALGRLTGDDLAIGGTVQPIAGGNPPIISNISHTPATDIFSTTTVSVSADVTDTDGTINLVQCKWGTETGDYPNTLDMSLDSGSTYITDYDIPAQSDGTTVYYVIYAEDDEDGATTSFERSYNVKDPVPPPEGLIHYWNFNNVVLEDGNWKQPIIADIGSGSLEYTFSIAISFGGSTLNGIDDETAGGSFSPEAGTDTINNGEYFDLIVPTTEYENIELSYATCGTGTGFKTHEIQYSIDGGDNFVPFELIDGRTDTNYSVQTINFSSVIGANNNPNFVIRIVLDGATGASGNNCFDNIRIMGDAIGEPPVPVELSSFTATVSAQNYVTLTWVTQTETAMRGYYVYRAPINDLAGSQIVSPMIESVNSSQQQTYIYEDQELYESGIYYYWLQANDLDGSSAFHGPVSVVYSATGDNPTPEIPLVTQLHSVYPNPFNPTVFIPFSLAEDGAVSFKIYNSRGQMVKHFDLGAKTAGHHRITWDGTDYDGKALANGVFQIMMSTENQTYQSKATLLK